MYVLLEYFETSNITELSNILQYSDSFFFVKFGGNLNSFTLLRMCMNNVSLCII